MLIKSTSIPGCLELLVPVCKDKRGTFVKIFHDHSFKEKDLETNFPEEYYSFSHQRVLRGLHFQRPPAHCVKLVSCLFGEIFDVVVDLRKGSPTFLRHETFLLSAAKANLLCIPTGLAHGFYVQSDSAIVLYKVSTLYSPTHDTGILWNSAGIPWPDTSPIISERDLSFSSLKNFKTPFTFKKETL
jgi:dTDP-4-dehydrorhamnose 3,5-epimerase